MMILMNNKKEVARHFCRTTLIILTFELLTNRTSRITCFQINRVVLLCWTSVMGESYHQHICLLRFYNWSIRSNVVVGVRNLICINFTIVVVQVWCTVTAHLNMERWNIIPPIDGWTSQTVVFITKQCLYK